MRHGKKFNHLSRSAAPRKALLMNLAKSLVLHKRIHTTVAKAKALRKFVEPILTRAKSDTTHARRIVFSHFQDKIPTKELFNQIAPKIMHRPGGYTRIIRLGNRLGDHAAMCMIELVDYNELYQKKTTSTPKTKTRRSRKAKSDSNPTVPQQVSVQPQMPSSTNLPDTQQNVGSPEQEQVLHVEAANVVPASPNTTSAQTTAKEDVAVDTKD